MGKNRLLAAVAAFSLLGPALAGCSPEERPGPEQSAAALAEGLSRLDVTGNEFAGSTVEAVNGMLEYEVSGMNITPSVTVAGIDEVSSNEAVATLKYVWDVNASPDDFSYETTVTLERGPGSRWQTRFRSTTVHPDLLPGQRLVRKASPPPRADILGAGGSVLMRHWPVWRVGLDKSVLGAHEYASSVFYLSLYLGLDADALAEKVQAAAPDAFIEAVTVRQDKVSPAFETDIATIPGAAALPERQVLAPSPGFAAELLGSVGPATEEMAADGPLAPGDLAGISGLQREYDSLLRGSDAVTVRILNADNTASAPLFEAPSEPGEALETTLDLGIQSRADAVLADSPGASLVALQPSTGNLLAAGGGPGTDGTQTALRAEFSLDTGFEPADALARLRAGGSDAADDAALGAAAEALGLGVASGLGTEAFYGAVTEGSDGTQQAEAAGAGDQVLASPLAAAVAAATVARGERVSPVLVLNTEARGGGGGGPSPSASGDGPPALSPEEAASLRRTLRANVAGDSAGETFGALQSVSGEPVLAAAGTAGTGGGKPGHGWVTAIQGDIAVAVFVQGSSADAAALAASFLDGSSG
ncbi:hypothetical protein ITX31_08525 [Arthrobacter gandavensis]|uniref:hypothetical protein n=1 Tax=Arthrobacter gandavensis TaxID=169960 RepID=UPI00189089B3|nr:hypothetical protein [Arthrobacter gandavensis]MBF4994154.1 hypothetical protein [Arthrobacter gandavensis]